MSQKLDDYKDRLEEFIAENSSKYRILEQDNDQIDYWFCIETYHLLIYILTSGYIKGDEQIISGISAAELREIIITGGIYGTVAAVAGLSEFELFSDLYDSRTGCEPESTTGPRQPVKLSKDGMEKLRSLVIKALIKFPGSKPIIKAAELLNVSSPAPKGTPRRKEEGTPENYLDCVADVFDRRLEQGCFALPGCGEEILNSDLKQLVNSIIKQDRKHNIEAYISDLRVRHPLPPISDEELAKLYRKQRPRLIIQYLLDLLIYEPFLDSDITE